MSDADIAKLWSDGLTRPEIAARLNVSLAHVRYVIEQARSVEAATEARRVSARQHGARSELGALARKHRLSYAVVYARMKAGKKGAELTAPIEQVRHVVRPRSDAQTLIHALPKGLPMLDDSTIEMIALAKFNRWSADKICQAFNVHPRQVQVIRAHAPVPIDQLYWRVAGERLTTEEIAVRAGVKPATIEGRIRRGWRGLRLLQPKARRKE